MKPSKFEMYHKLYGNNCIFFTEAAFIMVLQGFYRYIYSAFLIISILKISDAVFNFRCPVQSHWSHRADTICGSNRSYFCLFDKNGNNLVEFCRDKHDFEAPGRKLIVAGSSEGTLQGNDCGTNVYQPFKFLSSGNSRCVYKKSDCSEEGQVVFRNGTEKNDRSCRCDYTRGYNFITRPNHPCLCVPSKEDCSCYHKICPTKYILSPELQKEILHHWSTVLDKFVLTKAAHFLYLHIQTKNVIAIIGPTGTGKSAYAYHIAFRLKNEYDYTIVPARQPTDLLQYYVPALVCDLHAEDLRLTVSEKRKIFDAYIDKSDVAPLNDEIIMMYTFFPSLCSEFSSKNVDEIERIFTMPVQFIEEEINNYEEKSQVRYMSLAVLALAQKITKKSFIDDIENEELIKTLFAESGFQTCPSKKVIISHLVALTDTYVRVQNDCFEFIHETMQNIVLYGIAKTCLISVLKYCKIDVFKNQVRLACVNEEQTVPVIKVRSEHEHAYFTRLTRELSKGQYSEVFRNNQNDCVIFRQKWLVHLNKMQQNIPSRTNLVGLSTVLRLVSSLGYADYVSHFIRIDAQIVDRVDANGNTPLHLASLNGHLDTVKCLVEYSRNVHALNNDKVSPFFYACEHNEILVVKYFTNLEGDLVKINETYTRKEQRSVLHVSCLSGFTHIVQILLDHHAIVNIQDKHGLTPLHLTCLNGQYNTALLLLVNNLTRPNINALIARANINAFDRLQRTPIYYACTGNYKDIVELLIEYMADLNTCTSNGFTPLHAACEQGSIDIVDILIQNHSNVNAKEKTGMTPLYVASKIGNEHIVKSLIDNGALVNSATNDDFTPFSIACGNGHQNVANILLNNNANYQQRNKNGWTAFLFSCARGHSDIVKMLLNLEIDVNIPNKDGTTPLMLACREKHTNIVQSLLVSNADVNQCNYFKSSPLEFACYGRNIDIVNLLLEHGASTNLANTNEITPLHTACINNHAQVVTVLVEKRADVNAVDVLGETPLYKACFNGDIEIVEILLKKGAKINITDISGKSSVAIANEKGFISIVELLDNANKV
ncbi:uncharacterized protein LOC134697872 [Mytilus trossulus]|uniref:uncharacterized protein LOC134697872 n=1 Tax=Mytilus trossulus TaxID=6551 RepID=UPI003007C450